MKHYQIRKQCISDLTINNHKLEWSGVANFYTPAPLQQFFNWLLLQPGSEILQQHFASKYTPRQKYFSRKIRTICYTAQ